LQLVRREDCMGRDPDWGSYYTEYLRSIEAAALSFAVQTTLAPVHNADEIEKAIGSLSREPGGALIVLPSAPITAHNHVIVRAAARHRIPAVYHFRRFVADGGLAFYGTDLTDLFGRTASYVDRILKRTAPADLPVQQPTTGRPQNVAKLP
jgi:putative tryptophan/tyrosine transport system substrate-binding protein